MKTIRLQLAFACLLVVSAWGQQPFPGGMPYVSHSLLAFPVYSLNAAPVAGASLYTVGVSGQTTYCYWAVANYQIGSVLSGLGCIPNSANTLSGSNYNAVDPWQYPAGLSAGVDILRTVTTQAPSGACNCAVTTGVTSGIVNDQSNSLSSYTVTLLQPNKLALSLTNEIVGSNSAHLILRQGWPWPGTQVADLSAGGVGCGSGTAGNLLEFTGTSTCGNAPIIDGGTTGVTATAPATGVFNIQAASSGGDMQVAGTSSGGALNGIGSLPVASWGISNGSFLEVQSNIAQLNTQTVAGASFLQLTPSTPTQQVKLSGINDSLVFGTAGTNFNNGASGAGIVNFNFSGSTKLFVQATSITATNGAIFQSTAAAFSTLPTCNSGREGMMPAVTDSTTNTWGATITGGGTNHILAYCDGTNWTVSAK